MWANPKNLKVSGFPSPRRARLSTAWRPNSIRRVFSELSDSENSWFRPGRRVVTENPTASCAEGHPAEDRRGCTCCQDPDLRNPMSKLSLRIDLVIVPPHTEIEEVELFGADPAAHTSGLWPSDHAGVVAILKLPRN